MVHFKRSQEAALENLHQLEAERTKLQKGLRYATLGVATYFYVEAMFRGFNMF